MECLENHTTQGPFSAHNHHWTHTNPCLWLYTLCLLSCMYSPFSAYKSLDVHLAGGEVTCQGLSLPPALAAGIQNKFFSFSFSNPCLLTHWPLLRQVYLSFFGNSVSKSSQELCSQFVQHPWDSPGHSRPQQARAHSFISWLSSWNRLTSNIWREQRPGNWKMPLNWNWSD